jgi:hypothetical protein
MPLKKISTGIKKSEGGGLKKIDITGLAMRREAAKALDFINDREPDVLADMPEDLLPEQENVERLKRLEVAIIGEKPVTDGSTNSSTIKADLKRQGDAYKNQGAVDYYRVICFADGDAADEFFKRVGYPSPDDRFIDGHILAGNLNIELPKPKFKLQKIRPPQRTLSRLVTAFPKKGDVEA